MKIYTKGGDKGKTSLLGGARVDKFALRIEAYGTIDELNSHVGLVRSYEIDETDKIFLIEIQNLLFTMGSQLATEPGNTKVKIPKLTKTDIELLEKQIDEMDGALPPMKNFVLPGGSLAVAQTHVTRCICRRAERIVLALDQDESVDDHINVFLNRLSDYLFVLSRKISHDSQAQEIPWTPRNT